MPRRERVGVVLERVSPTPHAVDAPPAKTREEGEGYAPTITYFCASSKFSTSSGTSSSESDPWTLVCTILDVWRRGAGGRLILGVVVKTVTSPHA